MADEQKISSKDLAQKLKTRNPKWANVPDDQLVNAFLSANPTFGKYLYDRGPMGPTATLRPAPPAFSKVGMKERAYSLANKGLEALPAAGGALGGFLTSESGPGAVLGAMAGAGMGGSMEKLGKRLLFPESKGYTYDPTEELKDVGMDVAIQGGLEGLSRILALPARSILKRSNLPENIDVASANKQFDLNLTGPQRLPGTAANTIQRFAEHEPISYDIAKQGTERTAKAAEKGIKTEAEKAFGKTAATAAPDISGSVIQRDIERVGTPVLKQRIGQLKSALNVYASRTRANPALMQALRQNAKDDVEQAAQLATRPVDIGRVGPKAQLSTAQLGKQTQNILQDMLKLKDEPTIADLISIRSKLMDITPQSAELVSGEAPATAKHYVQQLTSIIDKSFEGTPGAQAWAAFRNFTRKGYENMEAKEVIQALKNNPEDVAKAVGPTNITGALRMRRMIFSYANQLGEPEQRGIAQNAWNRFRAMWFRENVIGPEGDILKLPERLKQIDPRVMNTIIGHDPEGQLLLRNTQKLSMALARVNPMAAQRVRTIYYMAAEAPFTYPTGKLLYSPRLTDKFIRTMNWVATHPEVSAANAARLVSSVLNEAETPPRKGVTQ